MNWKALFLISFLGVTNRACGVSGMREKRNRESALYSSLVSKHLFAFYRVPDSRDRSQQIYLTLKSFKIGESFTSLLVDAGIRSV